MSVTFDSNVSYAPSAQYQDATSTEYTDYAQTEKQVIPCSQCESLDIVEGVCYVTY